ncbi:MAG: aldo/keto reductase [Acidobacteriota bacterium]
MNRRTFLSSTAATLGITAKMLADTEVPTVTLGKSGLVVTKFALGGHHMRLQGEENGIRIIKRALDLGVTFFDSAAKYHNGESDVTYGKALSPSERQKIILMSKAQLRTKKEAMEQLETTLKRMNTDYLDLWQCHEVARHDEVDQIFAPGGSLEAFIEAKEQGKVRHIGFTGHHDYTVHQRLLDGYDGWETVQHPVNLIDPHYLSFIVNFLPNAKEKGLGRIAMKSNAIGQITKNRVAEIDDCLRFAWSQDVNTLVSGVETTGQLEHNVNVLKTLTLMSKDEQQMLLHKTKQGKYGSKIETYKKPEAGATHREHVDGELA